MVEYIIRNKITNEFWSNDNGWGDWYSATRFEDDLEYFLMAAILPIDGEWCADVTKLLKEDDNA